MRNFWIEGNIDGRQTPVTGGPRKKEDGMSVSIRQKEKGCSVEVVNIKCYVDSENKLHTLVYNAITNKVLDDIVTEK